MLDTSKLEEYVRNADGSHQARCPACAQDGSDRTANHLRIFRDGRFGCAVNPQDAEHRKLIFKLAGLKRGKQSGRLPADHVVRPLPPFEVKPWRSSNA